MTRWIKTVGEYLGMKENGKEKLEHGRKARGRGKWRTERGKSRT